MTNHWDEFSKSLSDETIPRRESLMRLGAVFAGAILSPLGLGTTWAGPKKSDPCKAFCKCRNKSQQSQCIAACRDCDSDPRFLCGSCSGGYACTDLANDIDNCGACYHYCAEPGPNEYVACVDGMCKYACVSGAVRCDGTCTMLDSDEYNCGACGNVCEEPGPFEYGWCENGQCQYECFEGAGICDGNCTSLNSDPDNCGECGHVCGGSTPYCAAGQCTECPAGEVICDGSCTKVYSDPNNCGACGNVCGDAMPYCQGGRCIACDGPGLAFCNGRCIRTDWDSNNCGGCGIVCPPGAGCSFGICGSPCPGCG